MAFNGLVLDMYPYVADDVFAKEEGPFGRRLIAGAMVFSLGLGLMAHNNVHTFSYGYDKVRFIKPVFYRRHDLHHSYASRKVAQVSQPRNGTSLIRSLQSPGRPRALLRALADCAVSGCHAVSDRNCKRIKFLNLEMTGAWSSAKRRDSGLRSIRRRV
jgi:hypothetical protein